MSEDEPVKEFVILARLKIGGLRYNGEPYSKLKRVNVRFNYDFYTLDIVAPEKGLSTSSNWVECLVRYWSINNEVEIGKVYDLSDGPNRFIGKMKVSVSA